MVQLVATTGDSPSWWHAGCRQEFTAPRRASRATGTGGSYQGSKRLSQGKCRDWNRVAPPAGTAVSGSPYLDTFGAGVQGVRPAARALPAPRAAGRGHTARAAQAAAVTTCAERGDAVRAPSPGTPRCGRAPPEPPPHPAPCPRGHGGSQQHTRCTCKGFPQHPDLLRGGWRCRSALRRREVGRAHVSPAGPLVAEQREQPSGVGGPALGLHRCGTGRGDRSPGAIAAGRGETPSQGVGSPATAVPRDASAVPGACPQPQAGSDSDHSQETVLQGPPPCHQPGTDLRWDVPVPRLSPGRGRGPCCPCAEQDRDTTHSRGAKGAGQTRVVGTRVPIPLSPGQEGAGCAPAAACTYGGGQRGCVGPVTPHMPE